MLPVEVACACLNANQGRTRMSRLPLLGLESRNHCFNGIKRHRHKTHFIGIIAVVMPVTPPGYQLMDHQVTLG